MKRTFSQALVAICAAVGLSACETAAPVAATPAAGDAAAVKDTADAGVGAGDTATDAAKDVSTTTDTAAAGCSPKCASGETCDTKTKKCVAPAKPCDGKCTAAQYCDSVAKACKDVTCAYPTAWGKELQKISKLALTPEKGLVEGTTCKDDAGCDTKLAQKCNTSKGKCEVLLGCDLNDDGKNDNVFGKVQGLYDVNTLIKEKVADGTIVILFDPSKYVVDGTAFVMNMLFGALDEEANKGCDVLSATANCKYTVSKLSYDFKQTATTCPPLVVFDNTKVTKGKMTAGGEKQVFSLNIEFSGIQLALKISKAQLFGAPTKDTVWETTKNGQICGVITKTDLDAAVDAVPDETLASAGLDKATVKGLIGGLLKPDIDSNPNDDNKTKDAISVSLDFETVKAQVTTLTPDKK